MSILVYLSGVFLVGGLFAGLWWAEEHAPASALVGVLWPFALPTMLFWLIGRAVSAKMQPKSGDGKDAP